MKKNFYQFIPIPDSYIKERLIRLCPVLLALLWCTLPAFSQDNMVSGKVTTTDNEPLPGVNVVIQGTAQGTVTDIDGNFALPVPNADAILVFSFIGYAAQEVPVNGRSMINVTLEEDIEQLEEVVVVGYGTQRKSDLTGSISQLNGEELTVIPTPSVTQAIQGKVAGVQVTQNSGEPGATSTVRIRGVGTLNNSSPLYVVDGMLMDDISFLNPNDIESLTVLKDASAAAIYGARGANGVIIVTTKGGGYNQEPVFTVDAYYGWQTVASKIELANATQYAQLSNEVSINEGRAPIFANPAALGEGTDWQDVIFDTAPVQNYQIGVKGGSDNVSYNVTANYFRQDGIVRGSDYERTTLRINNEYKFSDAVTFGHNIALVYSTKNLVPNVTETAYRADPTLPVRNAAGNFSDLSVNSSSGNPAASLFYSNNSEYEIRGVGNLFMDVRFLEHFTFRTNLGLDAEYQQGKNFLPVFFVSSIQQNEENDLDLRTFRSRNWLWENTVTYNREWEEHRLTVLGGITTQDFYSEDLDASRDNLLGETESFYYLDAGEEITQTNSNIARSWSMLSYLFRTNYSFLDRYLLTASLRVDGSSRFGANNRYGYFPSVAVGWRIIDEAFMQDVELLSNLKLRGSWGMIGNDKIGEYEGRPLATGNLGAVFGEEETLYNGVSLIDPSNPDIQWEATTTLDVGVEFGLLQNRLTGEVDYYNRETSDILVAVPIPAYVGANSNPTINAARVKNEGFDFNLDWRESRDAFSYNIGIVASTVKNEVLELGQGREPIFDGPVANGNLATRTDVGDPIGSFYGLRTIGVIQNQDDLDQYPHYNNSVPGDLLFADTDGNGIINAEDRVNLGSPVPDFLFGMNMGVTYREFDLSLSINGQTGNKIYNAKKGSRFGTYNFEESYLNRWTGPGTSNTEPRATNGGNNYNVSDRFLEDGDFIRLRNIQLGYTLPANISDRLNVSSVRVYVSGTNLITLTDYSGYTPEIGGGSVLNTSIDRGVYPIARTITAGLHVAF